MNMQQGADLWQRRARAAPREIDNALVRAAAVVQALSRFQMNRLIYSRPPDVKKDGEPKWKQTRRLYEAERAVPDVLRDQILLMNEMIYARARHELGRDGRKTTRTAHWRDAAAGLIREHFAASIRQAVLKVWERP